MTETEKRRVNLMIDADVTDMLDSLAGGERKRGAYISDLIRVAYAGRVANEDLRTMDIEALRLMVMGMAGQLQALRGDVLALQAKGAG